VLDLSDIGTQSQRMRRNGYSGTSGQKSDPAIRSGDLDLYKYGNNSSISIHFPVF